MARRLATARIMLNIPEAEARSYAPYVVITRIDEIRTGMQYHLMWPQSDLRGIERTMRSIRSGEYFSRGFIVRQVWLAYNAIELPIPIEGIRGVFPDTSP